MPDDTFFSSGSAILRTIAIGLPIYLVLLLSLRISGKRSLGQMNAFDLVVTISLGSIMATTMLSKQTSLAEGVTALVLLLALQFLITWLSVRSAAVRKLARAEPALLFHDGSFVEKTMKRERVSRDEILQAVRSSGLGGLDRAGSVILETNGAFSVISKSEGRAEELLSRVKGGP